MGKSGLRTSPFAHKESIWAAEASHDHAAARPSIAGSRILIVDDNKDLATSLARLLRLLGHEVEVVFDGLKAIEVVRAYHPRVVLLDLGLPSLDGYQVTATSARRGSMIP